jgi:hypothetical protein
MQVFHSDILIQSPLPVASHKINRDRSEYHKTTLVVDTLKESTVSMHIISIFIV